MYLERDGEFWEYTLKGKVLTTRVGQVGNKGVTRTFTFASAKLAQSAHDAKLAAQLRRGFVDAQRSSAPRTNPQLEAALRADRDDGDAYDVYADWLQANGSSLGELIALHRAKKKGKRVAALEREHGGIEGMTAITWKWGLWNSLEISNEIDPEGIEGNFDAKATAAAIFGQPACAVLAHLAIVNLQFETDYRDVPAMVAAAKPYPWARFLESLAFERPRGFDMNHHVVGDIGAVVSASFPNLERLRICSGEQDYRPGKTFSIAKLNLPKLEQLTIESCAFKKQRVKELFAANLPALTALEVWFGEPSHGVTTTLKDLQPLLAGKVFPNLTKLGLCNAEFEDELARTIHTSPLAKQLVSLSLTLGTLDDASAGVLAQNAARFPKLEQLDVSDNFLSPTAIRALKRAFRSVIAKHQSTLDRPDEQRYVAVRE